MTYLTNVTLPQRCLSLGRVCTGRLREEDFFVRRQRCLRPGRPERDFGDRSPSTTASFGEPVSSRRSSRKKSASGSGGCPLMKRKWRPVGITCHFKTSKSRKAGALALLYWPVGSPQLRRA